MPRQLKGKDVPRLRRWMLKKRQNGRCLICRKKARKLRPCLDHHHKKKIKGTGLIRGVLCSNCNVFLARIENNSMRFGINNSDLPRILRNVADYLDSPQYPYMHPTEKPKEKGLGKSSFNILKKLHDAEYPRRKALEYPKSGKMIVKLDKLFKEFDVEPNFIKLVKKKKKGKKKKGKKKKGKKK